MHDQQRYVNEDNKSARCRPDAGSAEGLNGGNGLQPGFGKAGSLNAAVCSIRNDTVLYRGKEALVT